MLLIAISIRMYSLRTVAKTSIVYIFAMGVGLLLRETSFLLRVIKKAIEHLKLAFKVQVVAADLSFLRGIEERCGL